MPSEKPTPGPIVRVEIYRDEGRGLIIEALTPATWSLADLVAATPKFFALINVTINTPMGPQPINLRVPIEAASITEAFDRLEDQCNAKVPAMVRAEVKLMQEAMQAARVHQSLASPLAGVPPQRG